MYQKHIYCLVLSVLCLNLFGQNANSYRFQASSRPYEDVSGTRLSIFQYNSFLSDSIAIGFPFKFANLTYSKLKIGSEGYVTFDLNSYPLSDFCFGCTSVKPMLAPFWGNLSNQGAACSYSTDGVAPNRVFIVQWRNFVWPGSNDNSDRGYQNFQLRLFETSNKIEYHYGPVAAHRSNGRAIIGIAASRTDYQSLLGIDSMPRVSSSSSQVNYYGYSPEAGQVYSFSLNTCSSPTNFKADSILDQSIVLRWNASEVGRPTSYGWQVATFPGNQIVKSGSTRDTSVLVTGLEPGNNYHAYVYAKCSDTDSSNIAGSPSFTTKVRVANRTPFFEGFERDSVRAPDGWNDNSINSYLTKSLWKVRTKDSLGSIKGAAEGRVFMSLNDEYESSSGIRIVNLISPRIYTGGKAKRLIYKYWIGNNPNYQNAVGEPPLKVSITEELYRTTKTLFEHRPTNSVFADSRQASWQTQVINLIGYENNIVSLNFAANHLTMRLPLASTALDSIRVEDIPGCAPVGDLKVVFSRSDSIQLNWIATGGQTKWEIQYGLTGFVFGRGSRIITSNKAFAIGNLIANTTYDVYVRSICGVGDTSPLERITVKTDCDVVTNFPYHESFDSTTLNPCWKVKALYANDGFKVKIDTFLNNYYFPVNGRGFVLSNNVDNVLQSPPIKLDANPKRIIYFYQIYSGFASPDYFRNCGTQVVTQISTDNLTWTTLTTHDCTELGYGGWRKKVIDLSAYVNKIIFIRFDYNSSGSSTPNLVYLDDFTIENSNRTCASPTELTTSGVRSDNTVEVAWSKGTNETSWEVEYGVDNFKIGTGTRSTVTGGIAHTILRGEQLDGKEVYVRGICGIGQYTRWVGPVRFNSPRIGIYNYNNQLNVDTFPIFYSYGREFTDKTQTDWKIINLGIGKPSNMSKFFRTFSLPSPISNGILADISISTPRILNIRARTHQLSFRVKANSTISANEKLSVGVMNDRFDSSSYQVVQEYTFSRNESVYKTVDFSNYNLDKEFIVFKWIKPSTGNYTGTVAVDSIAWEKIPTCGVPTAVKIDTVKYNGISASWQNGTLGTPSGYKWRILPANACIYDLNRLVKEGTTPTNRVKVVGLNPLTTYDLYIQSYCNSPTDTATYWTKNLRFTTAQPNDDCEEAIPLTVYPDSNMVSTSYIYGKTTPVNYGLYPSQSSVPVPICGAFTSSQYKDIWYTLTTPNSTSPLSIRTNIYARAGSWSMSAYSGSCSNLTYVNCRSIDGDIVLNTYVPNTKYYIRLFQNDAFESSAAPEIWAHCKSNCTFAPLNDDCQNALTLPPNVWIGGSNKNATTQTAANMTLACETNQNVKDMWYKFRSDTGALRTLKMKLSIDNILSSVLKYAIYTGNCGNFVRISDCKSVTQSINAVDTLTLLEADQDYYIRIWPANASDVGVFKMLIQGVQTFSAIPLASATTVNSCQSFANLDVNITNSQKWLSLIDPTSGIVAEINPYGNLLGQTTGGYFINSTGTIRRASGTPYLDRNIGIKVTNQPATNVGVRLYFTERERAAYFAIVGANPIAITHYAGALCLGNVQSGSGDLLPAVIRSTPNGNYYVEFNTTRFSGFFLGPNQGLVFSREVNPDPTKLMIQEVYPMPISTELGVVFTAYQATAKGRVFVTDILGKTILNNTISIESGRNELKLNTSTLANGLYILHISDGVYETAKKMIKQ